eukprot:8416789-Pyramimonas_sp.AAC.1
MRAWLSEHSSHAPLGAFVSKFPCQKKKHLHQYFDFMSVDGIDHIYLRTLAAHGAINDMLPNESARDSRSEVPAGDVS